VVGGPGLRQALEAAGARLVDHAAWRRAEVVAVGFDPELTYDALRAAALAIRAGARFVGSNPDTTLPTPEGFWPGAGATLAMLEAASGVRPEVAGKPQRALFETAATALGPGPYLMVGDRADTDLDGARRLGWATALVLSGVVGPGDLPDLAAAPDHLLADVGGLLDRPGPAIRQATPAEGPAQPAGGSLVAVDGERVVGTVSWRRQGALAVVSGPVVEAAWRGRLVGTRLLVAACIAARAAGLRRVAAPAHGFLGRFGFRSPGQGEPGGQGGPDPAAARGLLVRDLR
jgi:GNAT superfamily N-acetyltransferase